MLTSLTLSRFVKPDPLGSTWPRGMWSFGKLMEAGDVVKRRKLFSKNQLCWQGLGELLQEGFVLEGHWSFYKEREFCF